MFKRHKRRILWIVIGSVIAGLFGAACGFMIYEGFDKTMIYQLLWMPVLAIIYYIKAFFEEK